MKFLFSILMLVVCYGQPVWLHNCFNDDSLVTIDAKEVECIPLLDIDEKEGFRGNQLFQRRIAAQEDSKTLIHNVFRIFAAMREKKVYWIEITFDPAKERLALHQITRHNMQRSWEVLDSVRLGLRASQEDHLAHLLIMHPHFRIGDYVNCVYTSINLFE